MNLDEEAKFIKDSEKVRVQYMTYMAEIQDQRRQARAEGRAEGRVEGREEGREENLIDNIKALMKAMNWSARQAMDVLNVPVDKQKKLTALL